MITKFKLFENYLESDAVGYEIGEYLYHVSPINNKDNIIENGFEPKDGKSINGEEYENRLYFTTSLIAAYDLITNFNSYRDEYEYVIFKINSDCIDDYEEDPLFQHGIYIDYKISSNCIIETINYSELFNKFDDNDFDALYETKNSEKKGNYVCKNLLYNKERKNIKNYRAIYIPPWNGIYKKDSTNILDGSIRIEQQYTDGSWGGIPSGWFLITLLTNKNDCGVIDGGQNWVVCGMYEVYTELEKHFNITQDTIKQYYKDIEINKTKNKFNI